jgi:hypothetical protein
MGTACAAATAGLKQSGWLALVVIGAATVPAVACLVGAIAATRDGVRWASVAGAVVSLVLGAAGFLRLDDRA